jgi:predicted nucleic acid-binding protein
VRFVVDASIAIKWFVREDGHETAGWLLAYSEGLIAPELILAEMANIAWKKAARGEILPAQARTIVEELPISVPTICPMTELMGRAIELALELKHPAYDCIYLACAEATRMPLVSADAELLTRVKQSRWSNLMLDLNDIVAAFRKPSHKAIPRLTIPLIKVHEIIRTAALLSLTEQTIGLGLGSQDYWSSPSGQPNGQHIQMYLQAPNRRRLLQILNDLKDQERIELLALTLLGAGEASDWRTCLRRAQRSLDEGTSEYLAAKLSLANDLRKGLELLQKRQRRKPSKS